MSCPQCQNYEPCACVLGGKMKKENIFPIVGQRVIVYGVRTQTDFYWSAKGTVKSFSLPIVTIDLDDGDHDYNAHLKQCRRLIQKPKKKPEFLGYMAIRHNGAHYETTHIYNRPVVSKEGAQAIKVFAEFLKDDE